MSPPRCSATDATHRHTDRVHGPRSPLRVVGACFCRKGAAAGLRGRWSARRQAPSGVGVRAAPIGRPSAVPARAARGERNARVGACYGFATAFKLPPKGDAALTFAEARGTVPWARPRLLRFRLGHGVPGPPSPISRDGAVWEARPSRDAAASAQGPRYTISPSPGAPTDLPQHDSPPAPTDRPLPSRLRAIGRYRLASRRRTR